MGAFCVFGVSRQVCRKLAEKSVPTFYVDDKNKRQSLTAAEWGGE
jgi:protein-disulfide isomerase-like protein with CxxC motif